MSRRIPLKVIAASGAIVLASGVAAAAVTTPDQADDGLAKAAEQAGFEVPVGSADHAADHVADSDDAGEVEVSDTEGTAPTDTHGATVSAFATTTELTGRDKGQAISELARDGHGEEAPDNADDAAVDTPNDGGIDTATGTSDDSDATGADNAAPQATAGSANAEAHRR